MFAELAELAKAFRADQPRPNSASAANRADSAMLRCFRVHFLRGGYCLAVDDGKLQRVFGDVLHGAEKATVSR